MTDPLIYALVLLSGLFVFCLPSELVGCQVRHNLLAEIRLLECDKLFIMKWLRKISKF